MCSSVQYSCFSSVQRAVHRSLQLQDTRVAVSCPVCVACRDALTRFRQPHLICEYRRAAIADEDEDEMHEVQPEAVPAEVREWLASTFSRTSAVKFGNASGDRRRFRSVVNAVRAGLLVDRIYRRTFSSLGLQYPTAVVAALKACARCSSHCRRVWRLTAKLLGSLQAGVEDWSFNLFAFNELAENHALKVLGSHLLMSYDIHIKYKACHSVQCRAASSLTHSTHSLTGKHTTYD